MKRVTWLLALAAVVVLVGTGCDQIAGLDKPTVVYSAINSGASLRLTWTAVLDASGYEIKAGDSTWTTASTVTSFDVNTPAKTVEVRATNGDTKSDAATIDCGVVQTASVVLYGKSDADPTHPSGLAFTTTGAAVAMSLDNANWPSLDFVCDDVNLTCGFVNPGDYTPPLNGKGNALSEASTTFDALDIAAALGTYTTQSEVLQGGVYSLWIDPTGLGWSDDDHFAKMSVLTVEDVGGSKKVTAKFGYQPVAGLRWLVN